MKTKQVFYEGRVQGVGFRWTTKKLAQGYDVTGAVRNLPDGRVEMLVRGEPAEVDDFLAAMRESTLAGHITAEQVNDSDAGPFKGFQIIP